MLSDGLTPGASFTPIVKKPAASDGFIHCIRTRTAKVTGNFQKNHFEVPDSQSGPKLSGKSSSNVYSVTARGSRSNGQDRARP